MKVLVTGANGFLGSNVIRELNRRQYTVRAMIRPHADVRALPVETGTILVALHGNR
jgi:dihydroflavonol-4-reductase